MQNIDSMIKATVSDISTNNDSLESNHKALTGMIASLKSRYGDHFGASETSKVKAIEDRMNSTTDLLLTDQEIKKSQESIHQQWTTNVLNVPWGGDVSIGG